MKTSKPCSKAQLLSEQDVTTKRSDKQLRFSTKSSKQLKFSTNLTRSKGNRDILMLTFFAWRLFGGSEKLSLTSMRKQQQPQNLCVHHVQVTSLKKKSKDKEICHQIKGFMESGLTMEVDKGFLIKIQVNKPIMKNFYCIRHFM